MPQRRPVPFYEDELKGTLFVPAVRDFEAAIALALDDNIAVLRTQLDLSNVATGGIRLFDDQGRAFQAAASFAL